jgi:CRISPR-associated exonuclease Cas4
MVPLVIVVLLILILVVAWALFRAVNPPHRYTMLAADNVSGMKSTKLYSPTYGLVGKPDELRLTTHAETIPVEVKSKVKAPRTPYKSHALQVSAYCLLIEEQTGVAPPYGLLVYGDGTEWRIHWTSTARQELLKVMGEMRGPYTGCTTATQAKCFHCHYREICDGARSVGV